MMSVIFSKDAIVALHQLHPFPSILVLPPIFYYQLKHIFVQDKILFAQALTLAPHLSSNGPFGMVYDIFPNASYHRTILKAFKIILGCHCYCSWGYC
jgi:hypothetical protein